MTSYQAEDYLEALPELKAMYSDHYEYLCPNKDVFKLDPDYERYEHMYRLNAIHLTTVRAEGKLAGYYISFPTPHLHYKGVMAAFPDIMYLLPEFRHCLPKLIKKNEETLRTRGVKAIYTGVKLAHDFGSVLERLGYAAIERIYIKYI